MCRTTEADNGAGIGKIKHAAVLCERPVEGPAQSLRIRSEILDKDVVLHVSKHDFEDDAIY